MEWQWALTNFQNTDPAKDSLRRRKPERQDDLIPIPKGHLLRNALIVWPHIAVHLGTQAFLSRRNKKSFTKVKKVAADVRRRILAGTRGDRLGRGSFDLQFGPGCDRVGCRGLRPGTLPHHRTCGFPHPAVGRSGGLPSPVRGQPMPDTRTGWATSSFGPRLVSPEPRPQLSCSAASSVRSWPGQSLAWLRRVLRPFALPGFRRASSLLRPLLTSPGLSARGSPRVSVCSFRSRRWALQTVVSDLRASCSLAHSPPTACLSAHSSSCGRAFASRPFESAPCGDDLAVRLRLASQAPVGNFSSR